MGSPTCYACCKKEMMGWICEKMATPKPAPRGGRFSAFDSITAGNDIDISACNDPCAPGENY